MLKDENGPFSRTEVNSIDRNITDMLVSENFLRGKHTSALEKRISHIKFRTCNVTFLKWYRVLFQILKQLASEPLSISIDTV